MEKYSKSLVDGIPERIAVKWSAEVLDEGFVAFPKRLLRVLPKVFVDPKGMDQLRVVLSIADYLRPNQTRDPSLGLLAYVAGMTGEEFRKALQRAEKNGLVSVSGNDDALKISLKPILEKIMRETTEKE